MQRLETGSTNSTVPLRRRAPEGILLLAARRSPPWKGRWVAFAPPQDAAPPTRAGALPPPPHAALSNSVRLPPRRRPMRRPRWSSGKGLREQSSICGLRSGLHPHAARFRTCPGGRAWVSVPMPAVLSPARRRVLAASAGVGSPRYPSALAARSPRPPPPPRRSTRCRGPVPSDSAGRGGVSAVGGEAHGPAVSDPAGPARGSRHGVRGPPPFWGSRPRDPSHACHQASSWVGSISPTLVSVATREGTPELGGSAWVTLGGPGRGEVGARVAGNPCGWGARSSNPSS